MMPPISEQQSVTDSQRSERREIVQLGGAIIVGAGPSGLAAAACLTLQGISSTIIERTECIAPVWRHRTYDRLRLMLVKEYCELPFLPMPKFCSKYPTRKEFLAYLEHYAQSFKLKPVFGHEVQAASYDKTFESWIVTTRLLDSNRVFKYRARWLVVATGPCAENSEPDLEQIATYRGRIVHASLYKNGAEYTGQKVLVVGCGNTGTEVAADLTNYNAKPYLVIRRPAALIPGDVFAQQPGPWLSKVSFQIGKLSPTWLKDWCILTTLWLKFGSMEEYGIQRPSLGPFASAERHEYPVFETMDILPKIKAGLIKVVPRIEFLTEHGAQFTDGRTEEFDAIILATGYKSNVFKWLKDGGNIFNECGHLKNPSATVWKGERGLYTLGFGKRGFIGMSEEAKCIAKDISSNLGLQKMNVI